MPLLCRFLRTDPGLCSSEPTSPSVFCLLFDPCSEEMRTEEPARDDNWLAAPFCCSVKDPFFVALLVTICLILGHIGRGSSVGRACVSADDWDGLAVDMGVRGQSAV